MKLVNASISAGQKCKLCDKIETKLRRRQTEVERITRWQAEGRCPASVEKSVETVNLLDREIYQLQAERMQRSQNIGR
jgi:chorismate mutase